MTTATITNQTSKKTIVKELRYANTFLTRFKGLIGSSPLTFQQGLLISPCKQIHTHFMSYPIDVVFLDSNLNVLHLIISIKPWKISPLIKTAYYVLELPANAASTIQIGDQLALSTND